MEGNVGREGTGREAGRSEVKERDDCKDRGKG